MDICLAFPLARVVKIKAPKKIKTGARFNCQITNLSANNHTVERDKRVFFLNILNFSYITANVRYVLKSDLSKRDDSICIRIL